MKKIFCLIFLFFLPFIGVRALENDEKPFYSRFDKDYGIEDYNIDINVGENNTFEVTEKISVFFAIAQKGILKTIPLKTMIDKNNTTSNNRFAKVKNLKVNNKYTVYSDESNELIDIGDNNKFKNVTITEKMKSTVEPKSEKKTFAERHPILIGLFCSFVIGVILLFNFWKEIITFLEGMF